MNTQTTILKNAAITAVILTLTYFYYQEQESRYQATTDALMELTSDVEELTDEVREIRQTQEQQLSKSGGVVIKDGRFMLPAKEVQRQLKAEYEKTVQVVKQPVLYWTKPIKVSTKEQECLTKNIYHEAKGESEAGKVIVGQLTLRRYKVGKWDTICKTVTSKGQFSWSYIKDLLKKEPTNDDPVWELSKSVAKKVLNGLRVKGFEEATFYHATYIKQPTLFKTMAPIGIVGNHLFYNGPI